MIGKNDLETWEGKAEFDDYCAQVGRFIKSRIFSVDDAKELTQETITRILEQLHKDKNLTVNAGRFINTARFVLLEYYRRQKNENERYESNNSDEKDDSQQPLDTEFHLKKFKNQKDRSVFTDCLIECFEERSEGEQVLLWRYSFDEKYRLEDEEPDSYKNIFAALLESIREIRDKFLGFQDGFSPLTDDIRVKISRIRKQLRVCHKNCVSRKKGTG